MIKENTKYVPENYVQDFFSVGEEAVRGLVEKGFLTPLRISERIVRYPVEEVNSLESRLRAAQQTEGKRYAK
jgi:hypothetical protein